MKAIKVALDIPKANIWFVCPTYRQAEMIAWKMLFEMIPAQLIKSKNEVKLLVELINGSEICLKGADNEDSLRGVSLDYCILDEVSDMKSNVWQEIIRPMLSDRIGKALFIGTPKGKNHFWELFIKGQRKEGGFSSYKFGTADNPYISRSEIKEAQEQLPERVFNQEYLASFEDFIGLIWPEFDEKIHVVDPVAIPYNWESLGCIDPAPTSTTAALYGRFDPDGNLWLVGEFYKQDVRVSEVCDATRGKCKDWLIDPAAKSFKSATKMGNLYSLFDEYTDYGFAPLPYENDVYAGINRVAEYFKAKKIKIVKGSCPNLEEELIRYHWSEQRETVSGVSKPAPFKVKDHLCDCLRGLVMSRAECVIAQDSRPKPGSAADLERMEEQQAVYDEV